jgi:prophage antirepressor-like protein
MLTNELTQTFAFGEAKVTVIIENGEPLFCAKEVCDILGYKNSRKALMDHANPDGVTKRNVVKTLSNGREQTFEMTFIDERNLYRLVMHSDLPSAEKFQDWVCGEVLPTIRKTGTYGKPPAFQIPQTMQEALRLAADQMDKNAALQKQIEADAPKVSAYDDLVDDTGLFTATAVAKILHMKRCDLFTWLKRNQVAYQQGKDWLPYSSWEKKQWAVVKIRELDNKKTGEPITSRRLRFTAAGIFQMHKMMQAQKINVPEQLDLDI